MNWGHNERCWFTKEGVNPKQGFSETYDFSGGEWGGLKWLELATLFRDSNAALSQVGPSSVEVEEEGGSACQKQERHGYLLAFARNCPQLWQLSHLSVQSHYGTESPEHKTSYSALQAVSSPFPSLF